MYESFEVKIISAPVELDPNTRLYSDLHEKLYEVVKIVMFGQANRSFSDVYYYQSVIEKDLNVLSSYLSQDLKIQIELKTIFLENDVRHAGWRICFGLYLSQDLIDHYERSSQGDLATLVNDLFGTDDASHDE